MICNINILDSNRLDNFESCINSLEKTKYISNTYKKNINNNNNQNDNQETNNEHKRSQIRKSTLIKDEKGKKDPHLSKDNSKLLDNLSIILF